MRNILLTVGILILCACSKQEHPVLVDDEKAIALLIDLNLANVAAKKYPINFRDSVTQAYKSQICQFHDIKETELDTLLWQMQANFKRYNDLYLKLKDTLQALETKTGNRDEMKPDLDKRNIQDTLKQTKK